MIALKKINFLTIFWILYYLVIFFILLNNSLGHLDPDFGWHLRVGQQILADRAVPSLELYNYTLEGRTWVDHEWLINAISYFIYDNFGYITLNIFFALIIIITLLVLHKLIKTYVLESNNGIVPIVLFQAVGLTASLPHFGVRMQELTVLGVVILLYIISRYNRNKKYKILFWLLPLFYIWASAHAGFLIGFFILFLFLTVKILEILINKTKYKEIFSCQLWEKKQFIVFLGFSLAAILVTFFTAYGLELYRFLTEYSNDFYLTRISEWQPFYYLPIQYWQLFFNSLVVAAILITFIFSVNKKMGYKISVWHFAASACFLFLALKSRRHFPLFYVISLPLLINFAIVSFHPPTDEFLNKKWPKQFFLIKPYLVIALLIIIASQALETKWNNNPFLTCGRDCPYQAVQFIKNHPELKDKRILSRYGWGGYLIWMMPEKKLFLDGRLPIVPYGEHTLLEEYYQFFDKDKVAGKLAEHNVEMILIHNYDRQIKLNWFEKYFLMFDEEKINSLKSILLEYLEKEEGWQRIYKDEISSIFIKK